MGDQNSSSSKEARDSSDRPRPRFSPFSPFPYGSPLTKMNSLQTSFSGSPGQKMLLGGNNSLKTTKTNGEVFTPRLKGQDLYGGPIIFGSSARRSRLLSASPYSAAARSRTVEKQTRLDRVSSLQPSLGRVAPPPSSLPSTAPSSPHSSPGPTTSPPAPLSSTARLILSTLEKLSSGGTPVTDAKKIPLSSPTSSGRAEKRKLLETELNCSFSPSRRRPRLGGGGLALALSGPPLRKNFSPVPSSGSQAGGKRSNPPPSDTVRLTSTSDKEKDEAGPTCPQPSNPPNQAKSSLKIKSKVADSGRSKVDLAAEVNPASSFSLTSNPPQLEVEKLPVFNFTPVAPLATIPPTVLPARQSQEKLPNTEVKPSTLAPTSPAVSPIPPEVLERNNNDKSPNKRLNNEADDKLITDTKKVKTVEVISAPEAPVKSVEVSRSSPAKSVKPVEGSGLSSADIIPRKDLSRTFSFSLPQSVIESSEVSAVTEAQKSYSFSAPSPVRAGEDCPTSSLSNISGAVPCFNFKPSPSSSLSTANTDIRNNLETNFLSNKSMPDITNNTLRKVSSTNKLKGSNSNSSLPDVTASTGFGGFLPAKELKTGSVMDILGKKL